MATSMFMAGYRMQEVAPLEVTVRAAIVRGVRRWYLACVMDDGVVGTMKPDFNDYLDVCGHGSVVDARAAFWRYAERWIRQGLGIVYRSDLEASNAL